MGRMSEGFREKTRSEVDELRDLLLSKCIRNGKMHVTSDFRRRRFRTYECRRCRHCVGPEQLRLAHRAEEMLVDLGEGEPVAPPDIPDMPGEGVTRG